MKIIKFKKYGRAILLLLLAFNLSCDEDDPQETFPCNASLKMTDLHYLICQLLEAI